MRCRWKLLLLIALSMVPSGWAQRQTIRFSEVSCLSRMYQASLGLRPLGAARDAYIASFLDRAHSLYDLGARFRQLAQGIFKGSYPDLAIIADMIDLAERSELNGQGAYLVGIRTVWLRAVERPVASWTRRLYYDEGSVYQSTSLVEFEIQHVDGTASQTFAFREGDQVNPQGKDRRSIANIFIFSNGPEEKRTALKYTGGDHLRDPVIKPTSLTLEEAENLLEKLRAEKRSKGG